MRHPTRALFNCILAAALWLAAAAPALAQGGEDAFVAGLLQRMSPEVKIGQLFVVAFDGTDASATSGIADLILNYHVGGAILSADHGNIVDDGNRTPIQVAELTAALQLLALTPSDAAQPATPPIPLFIALEQDGGGPAYSAITSGLTPQPSPMTIGATWSAADAQAIGQVVGGELAALGVNLLLGPSLDVLAMPDATGGDVGVRSFGGDPYWVATLSAAFVSGLREGANGRIAAALKNFPGQGGLRSDSDTVDASLDQLQRVDLAPYYNLMQLANGETRPLADAVLSTHTRFRGFTGLRERTAPISVDEAALGALLQLPPITAWRDSGGVIVSGSLGAEALRRYYDPTGTTFPNRQIALDAFLAGNDVLVLDDFALNPTATGEAQTIRDTIRYFRQKYGEDPAFQERVDRTVTRILRLKYRLYPDFVETDIVAAPDRVSARLQQGLPAVERVAQDALTRLYPGRAQVEASPLPVPSPADAFLVFSDDRAVIDCTRCPVRSTLSTGTISQTLAAIGNAPGEQITSLGFADLKAFLAGSPAAQDLRESFARATWVILVQQNLQADVQQSDAARLLLRNRPELIQGKRVVLVSLGPPYQLTAEDLRLLTAYYVAYDMSAPFLETAMRAVFGLFEPVSAPPVSVDAIGYDLKTQTEPDPNQVIKPYLY
ncbi:MAG TPA: glycoside hydrolase family 3 N-terminal domain-containing protein, partial [Anaerolineae bacterium]|nr:glycoside hydrolase family 3 N-terminal domain-containing protein [Anaerolineae bacterium]